MFQISKSKRDDDSNRFKFLDEDGNECSLPLLKFIPIEAMAAFDRGEEKNGTLLACDTPQARAVIARLDAEQLDALTDEWLAESKAAGLSLGESEGSTDS